MTEDKQLDTIVATMLSGANKIGVGIDNYKEDRFMSTLRSRLPDVDFELKCLPFTAGCKLILIIRRAKVDLQSN